MKKNYRYKKIVTYEPDNFLKKGYFFIFRGILLELKSNVWLTVQMFKRDFSAKYKQSLVGITWAFIIPLISVGTFIILNRSGVFNIGDLNIPYPIFAVLGMAFWQIFSMGLVSGTNSLSSAGSTIVKINFSKKALVIAAYAQFIVPFTVQLILVGILFLVYGVSVHLISIAVPLVIIPMILLTLGLSFMLSMLNAVLRDIGNVITVFITFLMFLTPVLYAEPKTGLLGMITRYNPLFYLVNAPRNLVLFGNIIHIKGFIISAIISVVVFIICITVFHITEVRIAERV